MRDGAFWSAIVSALAQNGQVLRDLVLAAVNPLVTEIRGIFSVSFFLTAHAQNVEAWRWEASSQTKGATLDSRRKNLRWSIELRLHELRFWNGAEKEARLPHGESPLTPSAISSALSCVCFGDLPSEGSEMRGPEAPRSSHIDGADTKITTQDGGVHAASLMSRVFVGEKNLALVPAAASYIGNGCAECKVGLSVILRLQSPLRALLVATVVNGAGDVLLCTFLGYGIASAAWATSLSQYVAGFLMLKALKAKDYDPLAVAVPRMKDLTLMIEIAASNHALQGVQMNFKTFKVKLIEFQGLDKPLGQTAQSFMPELISGKNRDMKQDRKLKRTKNKAFQSIPFFPTGTNCFDHSSSLEQYLDLR
ncbi:hypothetical protein SELMODRAFT_404187 [Selaginella moellendorffii]|uniref:Polysaccharide biosynthesis protein C-terminal domain-containing protein n=1 Tax=Selaginella moellendorffii TaxID=88036 RepID=D8QUJ3_SELML|nr:hypothetical protein SELMODRAFT_404187 [Selaginella moellendorffii]